MSKAIFSTAVFLLCSAATTMAQVAQDKTNNSKASVKFLENISVEPAPVAASTQSNNSSNWKAEFLSGPKKEMPAASVLDIETAGQLQFKFALLMDTEVEAIQSLSLFNLIDDWMGTRYRLGGTTKEGIDCSAFMQVLFSSFYKITLPRTAREQYSLSQKISRTELKEGDLVFFNTTGGISHVGMYLQNNKFVHASSSGVTISDLYDEYWMKRFIGVGRIEDGAVLASSKP